MDPLTGVIILAVYPIVLVGALVLFGKYSKNPEQYAPQLEHVETMDERNKNSFSLIARKNWHAAVIITN